MRVVAGMARGRPVHRVALVDPGRLRCSAGNACPVARRCADLDGALMGFKRRPGPNDPAVPGRSAYDKALGMLARREHSRRELKTKLGQSGYAGDEADAAIARLGEQHYQDDERFAEVLLRSRIARGYGPLRLRVELKTHGFADARIRELLDAADVDWTACAADQLRRHYGSVGSADRAERMRRAQFLLRRGFAAATVRSVTQAEVDETADPDN